MLLAVAPVWTVSHELVVPASGASIRLTISLPTEVTVHFGMNGADLASVWVQGAGAMMDGEAMSIGQSGTSYSFWTWGGSYEVGAGGAVYTGGSGSGQYGSTLVWANVTTGFV